MTRVLIIEDEESYREATAFMLRQEGFEVAEAEDGRAGLSEFDHNGADIVLLDLMMPGIPGTEVCRQLRQRSSVGIIMVTARDSEIDKVVGLELGADDYVTKPFAIDELLARIRALGRRVPQPEDPGLVVDFGDVTVDLAAHSVLRDGRPVRLTPTEWKVLELLVRNEGRLVTRQTMLTQVWGSEHVTDTGYLRLYLSQLRKKLEPDPRSPRHLLTESGMGYRFVSKG